MSFPYKHVLGIPGQGFHAARLGPIALNDTLGTVAVAAITAWIFKIEFWKSFLLWFVAGEVLHYWFGTPTAFLKLVGLEPVCQS